MNNQAFKAMVIKAVENHIEGQPENFSERTHQEISRQLFNLFGGSFVSGVKVMIPVGDWNEIPKMGEGFRIGPVVGDCIGHVHQGNICTYVIMDVAQCTMDELTPLYVSEFGAIECPHTDDKYCNLHLETGGCKDCEFAPKFGYSVLHESFFTDDSAETFVDGIIEIYPQANIANAWLDRGTRLKNSVINETPKSEGMYYLLSVGYKVCRKGQANLGGDVVDTRDITSMHALCLVD